MAFGFPPKCSQLIPLEDLSPEQFIAISVETAVVLGWNIGQVRNDGFVAYTNYSIRSHGEELRIETDKDIATIKSSCIGSHLMDWGKNRINIERFIKAFVDQKSQLTGDILQEKIREYNHRIEADVEYAGLALQPRMNFKNFLYVFRPTRNYFVTPILIDINIIVFIVMVVSGVHFLHPDNESMIRWGANFRPMTLEGDWWRLFANFFLHFGIIHLAFNMYALLYIGMLLEPRLGAQRLAAAYILTGLVASMTSLYWHPLTISAGASGAIFGLYGVFLALLSTSLIEQSARKALLTSIGIFVVYNLINGTKGGIDNAAHLGGLISGLLIGFAYYPSLLKSEIKSVKYNTIALVSFPILLGCYILYHNIPNDIARYSEKMKRFQIMENMALELYKMPQTADRSEILTEIKDRGLYYWNEDLELVGEADKLSLPDQMHKKNKMLIDYCQIRIKSYELIYKAIDENTDKYKEQIEGYNRQIEGIIEELEGPTEKK